MAETSNPSVKKYYDYAQQQVDEQAIADKFNAATTAQFNVQREANRQAENQFYNQMYNTQRTAMDTIRQSNAAAVSSGASRGVQAANELSALLGLQEQSVAGATELAQANRQTAQEETAAVLENMLNAYQQAVTERQQLVQQGIESASVDAQQDANVIQKDSVDKQTVKDIAAAAENGYTQYMAALQGAGYELTGEYTAENAAILDNALSAITTQDGKFKESEWDMSGTGKNRANKIVNHAKSLCVAFGIDPNTPEIVDAMESLSSFAAKDANWISAAWGQGENYTKTTQAKLTNKRVENLYQAIREAYANKANTAE